MLLILVIQYYLDYQDYHSVTFPPVHILRPEKFSIKNSKIFQAAENTGIFGKTHFEQLSCEKFFAKITNKSINRETRLPIHSALNKKLLKPDFWEETY